MSRNSPNTTSALIYKPGAANRADELSRRPDLAPTDDDELTLVLPNHLFVPPETPSTAMLPLGLRLRTMTQTTP